MSGINQVSLWHRWATPFGSIMLAIGILATGAGGFELLSGRDLKPGWSRYQPPWTVPVFVAGLTLVVLGLTIFIASEVNRNRQARQ